MGAEERYQNMSLAKKAVEHVRGKMTIGASNRGPIKSVRQTTCAPKVENLARWCKGESMWQHFETLAKTASSNGCGNCGAQCAIALVYLVAELKSKAPVGFMDLWPVMKVDHQFLVIGAKGPIRHIERPATWGGDANVCDPWHDGRIYLASSIERIMCK